MSYLTKYTDSKIYVASLSAYNSGILHGVWIDLDGKDSDSINAEIEAMIKTCPTGEAEEYAIHDFDLGGIQIGESEGINRIVELVEALEKHGETFVVAYGDCMDIEEAKEMCEERFQGVFDSVEDWARDYMESTGLLSSIPEALQNYFDFEAYGKDAMSDLNFVESNGQYYVFNNA